MILAFVRWLEDKGHERRKGHWPNWFEMGAGQRECVECLFKRSGGPRGGRQRNLWAQRLLPLPTPL